MAETKNFKNKIQPGIDAMVFGKVPPQAKDLEEAILGAIMLEKSAFDTVSDILKPECFYSEANQKVFAAMCRLAQKNMPIDLLTVFEELRSAGDLENVGGAHYVSMLTNAVVSSANIDAHSRIVLQKFIQRELIRISGEIIGEAYEDNTDVFDMLDATEEKISKLRMTNVQNDYKDLVSIGIENIKQLEKLRERDQSITGVPSGFDDLDMVTCGWQPTDLIILAARPSVGKTAFALTLAKNAANSFHKEHLADKKNRQKSVAVFSLEMKDSQLVNRVLSQESNVWLWRFKNGKLDNEQMKDIYAGLQKLSSCKIFVDHSSSLQISEFKSKARKLKRKENVGLIIVDYLQLMRSKGKNIREQEISDISQELKATAKELDIPIIALSQLNRDIEKIGNKIKREPQLSDIRESGAIEMDADIVMFLWKPTEDDVREDAALQDVFHAKIEKHRNGALAKFIGKFVAPTQTHEYLKVVDGNSLQPLGGNWKPVSIQPTPVDFTQSRSSMSDDENEKLPF